ncbi:hypothetical protein V495_06921 [Pseudogymnoascus sp. VKM F-4514 (FW-929)]|nr:hypothetical protein V495_06921 [Pseudogymnoascus sp. VKM F-4514 (FW-929)]KFY54914.1 hypothetical protein V497_07342 [Pseudogymnoascus sp. VKM F-4516 (FW-969)]
MGLNATDHLLPADAPIEEEQNPDYDPKRFYPAQIVETVHGKYQIISKLGFGTDLKADNFLVGFEDNSVIKEYVNTQRRNPAPCKEGDGRRVYQSQPDFGRFSKGTGVCKISDFGAAFAAPEVLLGAGWTYSADIWNLGMVLWELVEDISLLDGISSGKEYDGRTHFAQMIRLLGPPPAEILERANREVYLDLYSEKGEWKRPYLMPPESLTFESQTPSLQGEDKRLFIQFARRMLKWVPEERATAKELYEDPWLNFP